MFEVLKCTKIRYVYFTSITNVINSNLDLQLQIIIVLRSKVIKLCEGRKE